MRYVRITWKRARGLTANDKANVILSALRARYRGRSRGDLEPCASSGSTVSSVRWLISGMPDDVTGEYETFNFYISSRTARWKRARINFPTASIALQIARMYTITEQFFSYLITAEIKLYATFNGTVIFFP